MVKKFGDFTPNQTLKILAEFLFGGESNPRVTRVQCRKLLYVKCSVFILVIPISIYTLTLSPLSGTLR